MHGIYIHILLVKQNTFNNELYFLRSFPVAHTLKLIFEIAKY